MQNSKHNGVKNGLCKWTQCFKFCIFTSQKHEKKRFYPNCGLLKIPIVSISACHFSPNSQGQPHGGYEEPSPLHPSIPPLHPAKHRLTGLSPECQWGGGEPTEASALPRASPVGDWTDARDPPDLATPSGPDSIGALLQVGPTPATIGPRKPDNGDSPTPDDIVL